MSDEIKKVVIYRKGNRSELTETQYKKWKSLNTRKIDKQSSKSEKEKESDGEST